MNEKQQEWIDTNIQSYGGDDAIYVGCGHSMIQNSVVFGCDKNGMEMVLVLCPICEQMLIGWALKNITAPFEKLGRR